MEIDDRGVGPSRVEIDVMDDRAALLDVVRRLVRHALKGEIPREAMRVGMPMRALFHDAVNALGVRGNLPAPEEWSPRAKVLRSPRPCGECGAPAVLYVDTHAWECSRCGWSLDAFDVIVPPCPKCGVNAKSYADRWKCSACELTFHA